MIETKVTGRSLAWRVRYAAISATVWGMLCVPGVTTDARAQDGALDVTYGIGGSVIVDVDNLDNMIDAAMQDDGKMVVAGRHMMGRFRVDGSLDPAFGSGGVVSFEGLSVYMADVAIQPDGKIVVAGKTFQLKLAVARYHTNGTLDQSFGVGGVVKFANSYPRRANSVAVAATSDGRIVAVTGTGNTSEFDVVRFNPNGSLDTSFQGGIVTTLIVSAEIRAFVQDVALQRDGKIVVAGDSGNGHVLVRYTSTGTLDTSFSGDGIVLDGGLSAGNFPMKRQLAIQPDGRILITIWNMSNLSSSRAVARYGSDGTRDSSFGVGGYAQIPNSVNTTGIALQADGRIVAAGSAGPGTFKLFRLNSDGMLDTTFGTGGFTTFRFAEDRQLRSFSVHIQPDGRFVFAGSVVNLTGSYPDWGLARFEGPSPQSLQFFLTAADATTDPIVGPTQYAMTQAVPGGMETVTAFLPEGVAWTSDVPIAGGFFGNASFRLHLPCTASLAAASNVTVAISVLAPGQPVQPIASAKMAQTIGCKGAVTIDIPKTMRGQVQMSNASLRLAISGSFASPDVDLELGAGTFLEATGFIGTP